MAIPVEALRLIQEFESCMRRVADGRFAPYLCPANVPTVGWGSTRYPDGRRVTMKDTAITQQQADTYLEHEVTDNERSFDRLTTRAVPSLSRGAIVSFIYNCGSGAYQASNLRKAINAGNWSGVPGELAKWRMAGGRVLAGLVRRRAREADLFMKGVRGHNDGPPLDDPAPAPAPAPTPLPPVPPTLQPGGWLSRVLRFLGFVLIFALLAGCTVTVQPDTLCSLQRPRAALNDTKATQASQAKAAAVWDSKCTVLGALWR